MPCCDSCEDAGGSKMEMSYIGSEMVSTHMQSTLYQCPLCKGMKRVGRYVEPPKKEDGVIKTTLKVGAALVIIGILSSGGK